MNDDSQNSDSPILPAAPSEAEVDSIEDAVTPKETPPVTKSKVQKIVSSLPVDHQGTTVYVKGWRRAENEKHPIVIVHDLGENISMYRDVARKLIKKGHNVYGFDLRGHGRSGRRLGHAPSFNILILDLLQVAAWVRHQESGRPAIILGQGLGALITLKFTKRHAHFCKAVVLSAPVLELATEISSMTENMLKVLSDIAPMMRLPSFLNPKFSRKFKAIIESSVSPTNQYYPKLTVVFTKELLRALKKAETKFIEYPGSVLILCPEEDTVCNYKNVKKAALLHDQHNLRIVDLPEVGHNVFSCDEEKVTKTLDIITDWIDGLPKKEPEPIDPNSVPDIEEPTPAITNDKRSGATKKSLTEDKLI